MATEEFHVEIDKWNKKENLLELAKYKLSLDFSKIYWSMGIVLAIYLALFSARDWIINLNFSYLSGEWIFTIIISILSLIIIFMIRKISEKQKVLYENISYLTRKLDGQIV